MQNRDEELRVFLRAHDPVDTIAPLRLARIEDALMQRLISTPQETEMPVFSAEHAGRLGAAWALGRLVTSALLCLLLGFWVGADVNGARQTVATQAITLAADTGVSANLPLMAMASPWHAWVMNGEEQK